LLAWCSTPIIVGAMPYLALFVMVLVLGMLVACVFA
jgi:hypothetical protein